MTNLPLFALKYDFGSLTIDIKNIQYLDWQRAYYGGSATGAVLNTTANAIAMQALRDVFDTNYNGKLDAGDAHYADFKILVTNADGTTTLKTLAQAGVSSVNLIHDATTQKLPDGYNIDGQTTFTKTDGSTGTAAAVSFAYDAQGNPVSTGANDNIGFGAVSTYLRA